MIGTDFARTRVERVARHFMHAAANPPYLDGAGRALA